MFTLTKTFRFEACHSLPHLGEDHKCSRLHGHSYKVVVTVQTANLDTRGFAGLDYAEFDVLEKWLARQLDHRNIDNIVSPSTAECLAKFIYDTACELLPIKPLSVTVHETDTTSVEYRPL